MEEEDSLMVDMQGIFTESALDVYINLRGLPWFKSEGSHRLHGFQASQYRCSSYRATDWDGTL